MSKKVPFGKLSTRMLSFWVDAGLTAREWLVFMALHSYACWEGKVFQTQAKMAKAVKMDASNFSKAVKRLEELEVIKRHESFIQLSRLCVEYGDWSSGKEISARAARQECRVVEQEAGREGQQQEVCLQPSERISQKPPGQLVSFPSKQRADDLAGS